MLWWVGWLAKWQVSSPDHAEQAQQAEAVRGWLLGAGPLAGQACAMQLLPHHWPLQRAREQGVMIPCEAI